MQDQPSHGSIAEGIALVDHQRRKAIVDHRDVLDPLEEDWHRGAFVEHAREENHGGINDRGNRQTQHRVGREGRGQVARGGGAVDDQKEDEEVAEEAPDAGRQTCHPVGDNYQDQKQAQEGDIGNGTANEVRAQSISTGVVFTQEDRPFDGEFQRHVHGTQNQDGDDQGVHHPHQVSPGGMGLVQEQEAKDHAQTDQHTDQGV